MKKQSPEEFWVRLLVEWKPSKFGNVENVKPCGRENGHLVFFFANFL